MRLKKPIVIAIICTFALSAFLVFSKKYDTNIYFSKETGYYNKEFRLRITGGAGNKIYYTLDGSEPTIDSKVYDRSEPIIISDASVNENVYSARTDISTGFLTDYIEAFSYDAPGYTVPKDLVDKCNVVRAAVFDEEGNVLDEKEAVYFVGFQDKTAYEDVYTVSIVTDPENLFGYEKGIYTLGAKWDEFEENSLGKEDVKKGEYWWWWPTNYSNGGLEWEREANVTVFNDNHGLLLSEECGIRIQGGGSRGFLPKSIGCYARDEYSGNNRFSADLFSNNKNPHKFVLFSGGDDNVFKLKDYLVNTLAQDLNFATMKFIPCVVFLNGEFWGSYYMIENYNAGYIADHYGVDKENIAMFKNSEIKEGTPEDKDLYYEMIYYISPSDMTNPEYYEQACKMIDIDSTIDYFAAQVYIARLGDWPDTNYALWRTETPEDSEYGDCKWRWMMFDVNSGGLDFENVENDTLTYILENKDMFNSLYQNEEFRVKFINRLLQIGKEVYSLERVNELIDHYVKCMKEPVLKSNLRFYNEEFEEAFDNNVEQMRTFFEKRYDVIWDIIVEREGEAWLQEHHISK